MCETCYLVTHNENPDGTVVIAGNYMPSPRANQIITVKLENEGHCNSCYMCKLNLDVKHTVSLNVANFFIFNNVISVLFLFRMFSF